LGARSVTQQVIVNPKSAEVMATICAVQFSKEPFFKVIFNENAAQFITEINSNPLHLS
jgi:hypothetical protein